VIDALFETYPNSGILKVNGLLLRYIDAVDFDYKKDDILSFLKDKMKVNIDVQRELFEDTGVVRLPLGFNIEFSFPSTKPGGIAKLRFTQGKRKETDILVWETMVQSIEENTPETKSEIIVWIEEAHSLIDDWFFKIIEGELLRRFE